jgi:hypothetical protein
MRNLYLSNYKRNFEKEKLDHLRVVEHFVFNNETSSLLEFDLKWLNIQSSSTCLLSSKLHPLKASD